MELIDRQDAITAIDDMLMEDEQYKVWLKLSIKNIKPVDAVPIEWINQRVKGLKIQLINADEDDVDLIWHLRDEIQTLTELIDYWKEEQEKANDSFDKCG